MIGDTSSLRRYVWLPACLILLLQAGALRVLSISERNLPLPDLAGLPVQLSSWEQRGTQFLDEGTKEYLRPDEYIIRDYVNPDSGVLVNLFVAYFKSSQGSHGPHSPSVCLPGSGWLVRSSATGTMRVAGWDENVPVNEYAMEKSGNRILVVYWYQNNRAVWADEFRAKLRLLPDLVRYRRSDVSLVRIISPAPEGGADFGNILQFAKVLFPVLAKHFELAQGSRGK